jgi:cytochrome c-type biogenesis protein CcmH/NrfG
LTNALELEEASPSLLELTKALQEFDRGPDKPEEFIAALVRITQRDARFFPAWLLLAEFHWRRGQTEEALAAARNACRNAPTEPRPARLASELLAAAGRLDEALVMARKWQERSGADPYPPW